MELRDLDTPQLILDEERMLNNINKLKGILEEKSVTLRPHLKTCKSLDVAREIKAPGPDASITVSTLKEAEYFFQGGYGDILYAVSITPHKLTRLKKLQDQGATITLILDHLAAAKLINEAAINLGTRFPVLIEIDCDGKRAGLNADDPALVPLGQYIDSSEGLELAGVMTHSGGSYASRDIPEIRDTAVKEQKAITTAAARLKEAGLPCPIVSVGSTPTATYGDIYEGVTEVRAGVYVFQDMVMEALNVCDTSDIAISVLATVISHNEQGNRVLIDAGSLALSADPGKPNHLGQKHFGQVCRADTCAPIQNLFVTSMNQEHGLISLEGLDYNFEDFPIGSQLRILPNHACITAAAYDQYQVIDKKGVIQKTYDRCNGW